MIVISSRTKSTKYTISVGDKNDTLKALYTEDVLELITINSEITNSSKIRSRVITTSSFHY